MKLLCLIQVTQTPRVGQYEVRYRQWSPRVERRPVPGMAVGGQALPWLHTAASHCEGSPAAAVQLHKQGFGSILRSLPAVMSPLEHLSDVLIP